MQLICLADIFEDNYSMRDRFKTDSVNMMKYIFLVA